MKHASLVAVAAMFIVLAIVLPPATASRNDASASAQRFASVGVITTADYRVAVVAQRMSGLPPTAELRVGYARRVGGGWRELGERRLDETYFWRTVTGPRAVCRLEIETAGPGGRARPYATVRLLLSPSLGCGDTHRIPLTAR
jgi:hypothetical protein